jgi:hypothetical protein
MSRTGWGTAQRVVHAIDSHRPRALLALLPGGGLHDSAQRNAHQALDEVQRAVTERAALHEAGEHRVTRLSRSETVELLQRQRIARFAYVARKDVPDVVPVNYLWSDGCAYVRSGPGPKLQAAQRGDVVALEVDEIDVENRTGCSAVVLGRAEVVDPVAYPHDVDVWAGGPHRYLIRIVPSRVDGRRLE